MYKELSHCFIYFFNKPVFDKCARHGIKTRGLFRLPHLFVRAVSYNFREHRLSDCHWNLYFKAFLDDSYLSLFLF